MKGVRLIYWSLHRRGLGKEALAAGVGEARPAFCVYFRKSGDNLQPPTVTLDWALGGSDVSLLS